MPTTIETGIFVRLNIYGSGLHIIHRYYLRVNRRGMLIWECDRTMRTFSRVNLFVFAGQLENVSVMKILHSMPL